MAASARPSPLCSREGRGGLHHGRCWDVPRTHLLLGQTPPQMANGASPPAWHPRAAPAWQRVVGAFTTSLGKSLRWGRSGRWLRSHPVPFGRRCQHPGCPLGPTTRREPGPLAMRASGIGEAEDRRVFRDTKADFRSFGLLCILPPKKIPLGKSSAGGKGTNSAPGEGGTTQIPTLSQQRRPRTHKRQPRRRRFATMGAPSIHPSVPTAPWEQA